MTASLYTLVVLIWGTSWYALKLQLGPVPIVLSLVYRFALAGLLLLAWQAARGQLQRPRGPAVRLVLAQGLCLFCLNFFCFMQASQVLTSGLIAVVFSSATLWNAALARVLYGRRLAPAVGAGMVLGLGGLLLLFAPEIAQAGRGGWAQLHGLLWAVAGTLCFSCGNLLSAALQQQGLRPAQTTAWAMLAGTAILLAWHAASGQAWVFDASARYVASLAYLAVAASVIAFLAYFALIGRLGPEKAAYSTVLFPVLALNISAWLEAYAWTPLALAGLGLVMAGNLVVFRPPRWLKAP